MTKRRKKELIQAWLLFMAFAAIWEFVIPLQYVHEIGHGIAAAMTGARNIRITSIATTYNARPSAFVAWFATPFAMGVFFAAALYLLHSRRSVVLAAFFYGRGVSQFLQYWNSYDRQSTYIRGNAGAAYDALLVIIGILVIICVTIVAHGLLFTWNKADPRHIENPSLLHKGRMSSL